jgi:sulfur carrier protein ThiS
MSAQIKALGIIKSYLGGKNEIVVDAGNTVRETMCALNIPPDVVALVLVNDAQQSKDYRVRDGDVVKLLAVVGGGKE